jgi:hypothetical protein
MSVRRNTHAPVLGTCVVLLGFILGSCGNSTSSSAGTRGDQNPPVTVSTGVDASADMQVGNDPVAQYFAASGQVVYVSSGLYSSTCPPTAKATVNGPIMALAIEDPDGNCTADAARDTFKIEHVTGAPMWLVVRQTGQPNLRLALNTR